MSVRHLDHLFNPQSLAVIGASSRAGSVGAVTFANAVSAGFHGQVFAVNPKHASVAGQRSYHSVAGLPCVPELAVICTPAHTVPGIIAELAAKGCRAAVVLSAGLGEDSGDGRSWRQAMLDAAKPALLRILGSNCVGLLVPGIGLNASFAPANALPGRLALVSQSGAILTAALDWANARQIGFSRLVSLGEANDVDVGDVIDFLATDPATDAIVLYVESLVEARKFMSAARSAARAKPIIVLKSGRHPKAAHAAFSHTGALAGADLVYDAALRRAGAVRVFSTAALFDAISMLGQRRRLAGRRLAIVTNGGGAGILAADAAEAGGAELAELSAATLAKLDACLPAIWSHGNPVDIVGDAPPQRYLDALTILSASGDADAILLLHAPTAIASTTDIARAILPALQQSALPVLSCWIGGASVAEARRLCAAAGQPVFDMPEAAVDRFLQMDQQRENRQLLMQVPASSAAEQVDPAAARALVADWLGQGKLVLGMADSVRLLQCYGIGVVPSVTAGTPEQALAAARQLGYPVALKVVAAVVSHKSDVGGVALGLQDDGALRAAIEAMQRKVPAAAGGAAIEGYVLQPMVARRAACELIVGISVDPVFGPVVLFGQGGVAAELVADRAVALPPLNPLLAADLIERTRVKRLLGAHRNIPAANMAALQDVLVRVAQMAVDLPQLVELDINPLLADADGAVAVDARIRLAPVPAGQHPHARLAILPYPSQLQRQLSWQGAPLCLRPIRPEDARAHQAFFARLAPEDVHFRMFAAMRELSPAQLARFTQIDYGREMAFIATRTGPDATPETLGVARVVADPDNVCGEFAITVRSDLKGQGLGRMLMQCLLDYCRLSGLQRVAGHALPDNSAMIGLARQLGFAIVTGADGTTEMTLTLHPTTPGEP